MKETLQNVRVRQALRIKAKVSQFPNLPPRNEVT